MSPLLTLLAGLTGTSVLLSAVWAVQLRTRNAGLVDAVWSWCLGGLGVLCAAAGTAPAGTRLLLALLSGTWGLRLGTHLLLRNHGKPEDGRYRRFREQWGGRADFKLFWFFQLQALFAALLSIGFLPVAFRPEAPGPAALAAACGLWLAAVAGEGLADWQLERFKQDPANRGQVCRRGLWRYSRHPNYFFECLHWLAYLPLAYGAPLWWLALAPPAVMAFLLLKMSGIPLTEAHLVQSRPGYADYVRTTSAFVPWPPKKKP